MRNVYVCRRQCRKRLRLLEGCSPSGWSGHEGACGSLPPLLHPLLLVAHDFESSLGGRACQPWTS